MTGNKRNNQSGSGSRGHRGQSGQRGQAGRGGAGRTGGAGRPARTRPGGQQRPPQPAAPQAPYVDVHDPDGVRLQKLLAAAGVGSRRVCEDLIRQGRVSVDGQKVQELGVRIDPLAQTVHVDGERIQLDESRVYLAFNKPLGVVSTMHDEMGRPSVGEYVEQRKERLFHVGRLDVDTEGLLLLTNDGELANRLQHPKYGVPKTYVAMIPGPVPRQLGKQLREGVELEDGKVAVDSFKVVDSKPGWALVEVILHEGRKHIVRRMLEAVGHPVESLSRTDVGPVHLGELRPGKMRPLTRQEVAGLYKAAGL
ncbi:MAG TPA: pseudouridine synthase [Flexivirga sp.]|uniref:pseudouridine synthase n=1 Tax=Flexivirga sp. TaxID=1962927 RepID=UPI002C4D3ADC|nr:pseudouridine synthase [Flexivirga sp.]HWC22563.1 pseudouridine synthase [Flexivirga sp.]